MTDVQIFCNEEIKKSHEKFSATLTKTIQLLSSTISDENIQKGASQLDELNADIDIRLLQLQECKENENKQLLSTAVVNNNCLSNVNSSVSGNGSCNVSGNMSGGSSTGNTCLLYTSDAADE